MDRYNSASGATLRGLVSGMWPEEAPSSVTLQTQDGQELKNPPKPYVVFTSIPNPEDLDQNFCTNFFRPIIDFTVYGDANNKSPKECLLIQNEILDLYGDEVLTLSNGYRMLRVDTTDQHYFKDDEKFWNVITEMQYEIEKDF